MAAQNVTSPAPEHAKHQPRKEPTVIPYPPARESVDLVDLATKVNAAHDQALALTKQAYEKRIETGRLLLQAKKVVKYGDWEAWVLKNCRFKPRQALNYTNLVELLAEAGEDPQCKRPANCVLTPTLTFRQAARGSILSA